MSDALPARRLESGLVRLACRGTSALSKRCVRGYVCAPISLLLRAACLLHLPPAPASYLPPAAAELATLAVE